MARRLVSTRSRGMFAAETTDQYQMVIHQERIAVATSNWTVSWHVPANSQLYGAYVKLGGTTLVQLLFSGIGTVATSGSERVIESDALTNALAAGDRIEIRSYMKIGSVGAAAASGVITLDPGTGNKDISDVYLGDSAANGAFLTNIANNSYTFPSFVPDKIAIVPCGVTAYDADASDQAIIITGDSIMYGNVTGDANWRMGYAHVACAHTPGIGILTVGRNSSQSTMLADIVASPLWTWLCPDSTNRRISHASAAHGVNDLRGGTSAATVLSRMTTFFAATDALGITGVICTVTPFTEATWAPVDYAAKNTQRNTYNTTLRTYSTAQAAGVEWTGIPGVTWLVDADNEVGVDGASWKTGLADASVTDGIHPNAMLMRTIAGRQWSDSIFGVAKLPIIAAARIPAAGNIIDLCIATTQDWDDITPTTLTTPANVTYTPQASAGTTITVSYGEVQDSTVSPAPGLSSAVASPVLRLYLQNLALPAYTTGIVTMLGLFGTTGPGLTFRCQDSPVLLYNASTVTLSAASYSDVLTESFTGASSTSVPSPWLERGTYVDAATNVFGRDGSGYLGYYTAPAYDSIFTIIHNPSGYADGRLTVDFGVLGSGGGSWTNNRFAAFFRINTATASALSSGSWFPGGYTLLLGYSSGTLYAGTTSLGTVTWEGGNMAATDRIGAKITFIGSAITVTVRQNGVDKTTVNSFTDGTYTTGVHGAGLQRNRLENYEVYGKIDYLKLESVAADVTAPTITSPSISPGGNYLLLPTTEAVSWPLTPTTHASAGGFSVSGKTLGNTLRWGQVGYVSPISSVVYQGQSVSTLGYTAGTIADSSSNALATFRGVSVTNNSERAGGLAGMSRMSRMIDISSIQIGF